MRKNNLPWWASALLNGAMIATAVGLTWFYAMVFNPDIDSGTVWLLGVLFGGVEYRLARVIYALEA